MEELMSEYECPIHLELLQEPMSLKCLHRVCKDDVNKMSNGKVIECPLCKTVSRIDEVRRDFSAQKVLDFLRSHEDKPDLKGKFCAIL